MNKYINKIFLTSVITLAGMLGATSCTDYLDKSPYSDIEENDPYKNFKNFRDLPRNSITVYLLYQTVSIILVLILVRKIIGSHRSFASLPVILTMVISGDGLPVIILILLLYVVERLIHRNAVIRVICGNFAGMVSVRLTLV